MGRRRISAVTSDPGTPQRNDSSGVPSAADLGDVFGSPSSRSQPAVEAKKEVILCVLPYNNDGSVYSHVFRDQEMKVIHLIHATKPSVFYKFGPQLEAYLKHRHAEEEDCPDTKIGIEAALGCKIVSVGNDPTDEDKHFLFQPWRNAIYCNGDLDAVREVIMFIDAFIGWVSGISAASSHEYTELPKIEIQVPQGFAIEFDAGSGTENDDKEMDCEFQIISPETMAAKNTDVPPPTFPSRLVVANIEPISTSTMSIVWSGNTKPYRIQFEDLDIGGKQHKKNPNDRYGTFYRKKENISIAPGKDLQDALSLFGDALLKNSPVVVRVTQKYPAQDEMFVAFIAALKQQPQCIFA